ncbi:rCG48356, isoform CRA_d [Rattus norvegicus]|uniref:RCG48356, isoform CRA_d n=1 Tax=Rattus norvegicus TaxID=10116 RepID=A6I0Q2_RAT|nr:rCG48356, isoform CRA_d [Rattus norvegicus]
MPVRGDRGFPLRRELSGWQRSNSRVDWYSLHRSQELEKAAEILLFSSLQLTLRWERGICCSKEKILLGLFC